MPDAIATEFADDNRTRVTRWSFAAAGDSTGHHVHEFDYIVVPVTGGALTVVAPDGREAPMQQVAAAPYRGVAGTSHTVVSADASPVVFVEIELKSPEG
jgi:beta-alanine degradation protein BauB